MKRLFSHRRIRLLFALLVLQAVAAAWVWQKESAPPPHGFLTKTQNGYILAWRDPKAYYKYLEFSQLTRALKFAKEALGLETARQLKDRELEHLWLLDRFGGYTLFWKMAQVQMLNRITFQNKSEALYFAHAFRKGRYSPSPFGHAVFLRPRP